MMAVTAWLAPVAAWAQERSYDWHGGMHPMWWAWGAGGVLMVVMMLVFWGLIIAGILLTIRWLIRQGNGSRRDAALESVVSSTHAAKSTGRSSRRENGIWPEDRRVPRLPQ